METIESGPAVVIAGAGVAGLTAALCLARIGWRPVVVERAGDLRQGGYIMGLSGPGYDAAGQLGILSKLQALSRDIDENVYFDRHGKELLRLRYREFLGDLPYLVLRRTDLIAVLADLLPDTVQLRLGTTVDKAEDLGDRVRVALSDGDVLEADLLIGADGVRSQMRRRVFGEDERFFSPLGYRFGVYDVTDDLHLGYDFLSYVGPGHLAEYYSLPGNRLAAMQVWRSRQSGPIPPEDRWDVLSEAAAGAHPEVRAVIDRAKGQARPIVDDLILVDMPAWHTGRIALLGDAAHCLTLVSGQGAGLAMASALVLAEEVRARPLAEALISHDRRLRPAVDRLQARSRKLAAWFIPATPMAFRIRNIVLRYMPRRLLARFFRNNVKSEIEAAGDPNLGLGARLP